MKKAIVVAVGAIWVSTMATLAWAQGEFPMKYTQFTPSDRMLQSRAQKFAMKTQHRPSQLKALPKDVSGEVACFLAPVNGREVLMVLDSSNPPKLYVDTKGDNDLSDERPLTATTEQQMAQFGPISFAPTGVQEGQPLTIRVTAYMREVGPQYLILQPDGYYAGTVQLASESYTLALLDANLDGRYNVPISLPFPANPSSRPESDKIAIDLNKDGNFDSLQTMEIFPLGRMIAVKDTYYSVKLAPNGTLVTLDKVAPPLATLDVKCLGAELALWSDTCPSQVGGADGKWKLPAGRYMTSSLRLVKKDKDGVQWALSGFAQNGKLRDMDLRQGKPAVIKMGTPLVMKVEAYRYAGSSAGGQNGTAISINMSLLGQAGEQYAARVTKNGEALPPPKFRIISRAGRTLDSGTFEYG